MFSQNLSMRDWSSSRWAWFAILLTVLLYFAGVGLLMLLRSLDLVHGLTTPEMFYGPGITIVCGWLIFGVVQLLLGRKRDDRT
jgi:hypothetical protein